MRAQPGLPYVENLQALVVSRFDDIIEVLDRPDIFSSGPTVPDFPPAVVPIFEGKVPAKGTLLGWDNPDHDRLKKSVASFFVPRKLERFEASTRDLAHELVDEFVADGSADIKHTFALPLPLKVIAKIAGLDLWPFSADTRISTPEPLRRKFREFLTSTNTSLSLYKSAKLIDETT
jgi:cytochrome P450